MIRNAYDIWKERKRGKLELRKWESTHVAVYGAVTGTLHLYLPSLRTTHLLGISNKMRTLIVPCKPER